MLPIVRPSRDEVITLLADLVSINSVNPSLVPDAPGEAEIARYIATWLGDAGLDVDLTEPAPGRFQVVARLRGAGRGRSLLLNAHIDTVGLAGMTSPLQPHIDGDRLYGRGAYDMKAGLAAIMLAALAVRDAGTLSGDLVLACVMDEEFASLGTQAILSSVHTDGAVVTEPTGLQLCVAHKGFAWFDLTTYGRAAHGSRPNLGVDAIAYMGRVLVDIEALGRDLAHRPAHPLLGTASIHASLIEGGQELSSYPERCRLQVERRTLPDENVVAVQGEIERVLSRQAQHDGRFRANCALTLWRAPFEVSPDEPVVQAVSAASRVVGGSLPSLYGDTPWMDAALLQSAGIPTVVFGPGGAGAHAEQEYAFISEVALCAETLALAAVAFCGSTSS